MLLLVGLLLLQLPGPPILTIFSGLCTGSKYRNALNTELSPPRMSSSSLLLYVTCAIPSQYSLLNPLGHLHWSLCSKNLFTPISKSQTALFDMLHLTCETNFLLLFVFLISLMHHRHPVLLYHKLRFYTSC